MRIIFFSTKKLVNCWFGVLVGGLEFESYPSSEESLSLIIPIPNINQSALSPSQQVQSCFFFSILLTGDPPKTKNFDQHFLRIKQIKIKRSKPAKYEGHTLNLFRVYNAHPSGR